MQVINRNNIREAVSFDKITNRISNLCFDLEYVDPVLIAMGTIKSMYDGIPTSTLDRLSADICATKSHEFPDYGKLGGRILISNISKITSENYEEIVKTLHLIGTISDSFYDFCRKNSTEIQTMLDYSRDYLFDYFAVKTLEKSYLLKFNDKIVERPQHMWMRVAIQIHGCHENNGLCNSEKLLKIKETYDLMSQLYFTHATPTLFNSGLNKSQLSSCFLLGCDDNIESIFKMIGDVAKISKWSGGIGISLSNIRAKGSLIRGTNGKSDGIVPLCKTLESVGRFINQGGKRSGSIAVYLEPYHPDIFSFVELRKNTGDENLRARDLFLALWIPDIFMNRVQNNGNWSLMCPDECPGLTTTYGEEFEKLYIKYESEGRQRKTIMAKELWNHILESQVETGMPYLSFKDSVNQRNMQSQLGVIKNSNLCNEISLYSDSSNYSVCNLSSICLSKFVENKTFNFEKLQEVAGVATYNLNNIIDINYYPTPECKKTNIENRPIGVGVQGLADVFFMLGMAFDSREAKELNKRIFENIYYGCVKMSIELAKKYGKYESFSGSYHEKGMLQFNLFNKDIKLSLDWSEILNDLKIWGIRNSVLTALMPTASTSQICGNIECFEPITSNLYLRKTSSGEFIVVNNYLIKDLIERGLWTKEIYEEILYDNGSVQKIQCIPQNIKDIYMTAFELKMTNILNPAIDRSPFIDQQQSMNLFMKNINLSSLNSSHFYSWKGGLKTGLYYLRSCPTVDATKFGLDPSSIQRIKKERQELKEKVNTMTEESGVCPRNLYLRELCDSCSS